MRLGKHFAALAVAAALALGGVTTWLYFDSSPQSVTSGQTDVDRAEHLFDNKGVPYLKIAGVGEQRHPGWIAIYALAYAGKEVYDDRLVGLEDPRKFQASIDWLEQNLRKDARGQWVWQYHFDSTYNDISIKAPWSSAFAQATGIQALVVAYERSGDSRYIELARKAAQPLFAPLAAGGFLFEAYGDTWFEEIPAPVENPSHILNGHMRVLLALADLHRVTKDAEIAAWLKRGTDTLYRWLPKFDTGYWLRYDLNPRKDDLLFRFANPYGFPHHALAIDRITLRDPLSKAEISVDVGNEKDTSGAARIAGTHWGQIEKLADRSVRRLVPAALDEKPDDMGAPHTYFYLSLPGERKDNLRSQWYELIVEYYDDAAANMTVQQRAISPGPTFRDMRDGNLHLTGAEQWRKWIVPVRPTDLGYWVGASYAEKHARYLEGIAKGDARFEAWARLARGYLQAESFNAKSGEQVIPSQLTSPKQTPVQPIFDLDHNGVVRQFNSATSKKGQYHIFMIADQLLTAGDAIPANATTKFKREQLRREPALNWLINRRNYKDIAGAAVYQFHFDNTYNDVVTKSPWSSAFGQIYVLKALVNAAGNEFSGTPGLADSITRAVDAFTVPVENGGISFADRSGGVWYEEVPNATHVLNAHLVSVPELSEAARYLQAQPIHSLADKGIQSLRDKLHLFDTGYWLRYDQNPKKELLLQIDWLDGESSPLIDEVLLQNPQTGHFVRLDVGAQDDAEGARISGPEWQAAEMVDGKTVRAFKSGYSLRTQSVSGGTWHNAYLVLQLPDQVFADDFDLPAHRLIVRYKDAAKGRFNLKVQAIHEGGSLAFVPLRAGVWETKGDQQWKEAVFTVRPQDMGWYKGPDYQRYEVEQLQRIANLTNDWFFYQYAERQRDYLEAQREGRLVVYGGEALKPRPPIRLQVSAASPTYPGYGFENAIDGDPNDDYSAGIENQPGFVVLKLERSASLAALRLHWENASNVAQHVVVSRVGPDNTAGKVLAEARNLQGPVSQVALSGAVNIDAIRIDFSEFTGQPRILLRQMELIEATGTERKGTRPTAVDLDAAYLGAQEDGNPLRIFRFPITQRIKVLSDKLSAGAQSDHEKIVRFMEYIGQFAVGLTVDNSPNGTVQERIGSCGEFSNTLLALAVAQGIQGRVVNLANYPKNNGHTVAELFIDKRWRLYDPTYGAYYVPDQHPDAQPMSLAEILSAYASRPTSVRRVVTTWRHGLDDFTDRDIFVKAEPAGVIGPDRPMVFPLSLDLVKSPVLDTLSFGPAHQGADYLGSAGTNRNHQWQLTGLVAGQEYAFTLAPEHIGGDIDPSDQTFRLTASVSGGELRSESQHVFDFSGKSAGVWKIRFRAIGPVVTLSLNHPYHGPGIRYMTMGRYALEQTTGNN